MNKSIDHLKLQTIADACRRGLLSLRETRGSTFKGFPCGSCGVASDIVGRVIWETLQLKGTYICGTRHPLLDPNASHAWYEVDGLIIDITHDQFLDTGLSGWIFQAGDTWHSQFEQERREGFCSPSGWPLYPFDGYDAAVRAVIANGFPVNSH